MTKIPEWFQNENRRGAKLTSRCNGPLLKHRRVSSQLTQSELAKAAGFSERLIVKAEAGGTLSTNTLQIIAQAPTDTGSANVAIEDLTSILNANLEPPQAISLEA